jgi:hypothetical protein
VVTRRSRSGGSSFDQFPHQAGEYLFCDCVSDGQVEKAGGDCRTKDRFLIEGTVHSIDPHDRHEEARIVRYYRLAFARGFQRPAGSTVGFVDNGGNSVQDEELFDPCGRDPLEFSVGKPPPGKEKTLMTMEMFRHPFFYRAQFRGEELKEERGGLRFKNFRGRGQDDPTAKRRELPAQIGRVVFPPAPTR